MNNFLWMDFTFHKYRKLCRLALDSGYQIMPVNKYLENDGADEHILVIRHDVDRFLKKALRMAAIEKQIGITTTYYFRNSGLRNPQLVKTIRDMEHEIGYHYESLDEAKGDTGLALSLLRQRLEEFREICPIETVCMHGNPLTKWVNLDIWKAGDFQEFGLKGEAFLSIDDVFYFSDTGRTWDMSRKVKDILPSTLPEQINSKTVIKTTDDLINFIEKRTYPRIFLCVHPERWSSSLEGWFMDEVRDSAVNSVKFVLSTMRKVNRVLRR